MAADKVEITTKSFKTDESPVKWVSDGLGNYEVSAVDGDVKRGTKIQIHLKEDSKEFTEKTRVEQVIKTHSNFISFPIKIGNDQVNTVSAIWREPKSSIKKEQYNEFYKFLTFDSAEPLEVIHKSVDAPIQFNSLVFIPQKNYDFLGFNKDDYGLDLYVRRVLVQHKNKDLLPEYLSFVRGVVDSEDLPLNISRETLQENLIFTKISNSVTSHVLDSLAKMAKDDKEKYNNFWKEHGKVFKMGYMDFPNKEKYLELLRFNSSHDDTEAGLTSLADYASRMKKEQKEIYYLFGAGREAVAMDPHIEIFRRKGIEVLYLFEPVDEFVMSSLGKYKDFDLLSVDRADLDKVDKFEDVEKKKEKTEELSNDDSLQFTSLLSRMKEILGDKVTEVNESKRLQDSPACLVNTDNTMSSSMQKIMNIVNKTDSIPQKIMEINKDHKLIRNLLKVFKSNSNDKYITEVTEQLYESSLLLEGYLHDPHKLVNRINVMMEEASDWYVKDKSL
jgi:molecular chaperone HtpG